MFKEDLSTFFRDFSTPVSAKTSDGLFTFHGIFDDGDLAARLGETKAELTQPRITCSAEDAAHLTRNTPLTVFERPGGVGPGDYLVSEILPEGTGLVVVVLAPAKTPSAEGADELHANLLDDTGA